MTNANDAPVLLNEGGHPFTPDECFCCGILFANGEEGTVWHFHPHGNDAGWYCEKCSWPLKWV